VTETPRGVEFRWNQEEKGNGSTLYKRLDWDIQLEREFGELKEVYGDALGGILMGDSLKMATLRGPSIWGIWPIRELHKQIPDVCAREPGICYFMDASNVWFYGVKRGRLWEYDFAPNELNDIGPIETALEKLVLSWRTVRE
jgi:hypothetical protein